MKTLADLYEHLLRDVYHAEKQVKKLLPKLARAVTDEDLGEALDKDLVDVVARLECVEGAFEAIDKKAKTVPCEAMMGLVKEGEEVLEEADDDAVDAGILAAYQAIKHYEITRFGTLAAWSKRLGDNKTAAKFSALVSESRALDQHLTELAEATVNPVADDATEATGSAKLDGTNKGAKAAPRTKGARKASGNGTAALEK